MGWEQIARTIAPTIATGLLGPLGGVVTNIVGDFLFPPSTDRSKLSTQDVINRITTMTDPADVAKLREAELAVRKFEADNGFRFAQLEEESRQNARVMQTTALAGGNKTADRLAWMALISFVVVAGLVLLVVGLVLGGLVNFSRNPEVWAAVSGLIGSVLGYFSANANQVISFYFGSSSGSAAKTDQLSQHTEAAIAALGRVRNTQAQTAAAAPGGGSPVVKVEQTPAGSKTTVAAGEPEAGRLAESAGARAGAVLAADALAPPADAETVEELWQDSVAFVLAREGGFVDDRADRGGATNLGITIGTLSHFRGTSVTVEDVRNLTKSEAEEIYRRNYWDLTRCDDLAAGIDLCVFDTAVLCGPKRAGEFLQTALGMKGRAVDGRVGNQTIGAASGQPAREVINAIANKREQFHDETAAHDPSQKRFLDGWLNRVRQLRAKALEMADS